MNMQNLKIYVGCLPGHALESKVEDIFSTLGEIEEVSLSRKEDSNLNNKCVGSGYIKCRDFNTYQKILKKTIFTTKEENSKYQNFWKKRILMNSTKMLTREKSL